MSRVLIPGLVALLLMPSLAAAQARPGRSAPYYRYCADARAAGVAPLRRGDPGYAAHLDRDGDGIACETFRGRGGGSTGGSTSGRRRARRT